MPPVRDQGPRGACSVFAAVALLEYFEQRDLSEQCLAFLSGSDAGLTQDRLSYVRSHGVYLEQDCPYDANRYAIPDLRNAPLVQLPEEFEAFAATSMADPLEYIRQRIDYASPVAVAVWVVDRSGWYDDDGAAGFVYMPEEDVIRREFDDGVAGGHAIVITGYDDAWQLLQFRNSWSTRWGTGGYGYMSYDYFLRFRKSQIISY